MSDQFVDMLEAVQRPQIARLQAEVRVLREQLRIAEETLNNISDNWLLDDIMRAPALADDALTRMSVVE